MDALAAAQRTGVAGHQELGVQGADLVQAGGPLLHVPVIGAADGVEVGEGLIDVVAAEHHLLLRQPYEQLVLGLAGGVHQFQLDAGDGGFQALIHGVVRRQGEQRALFADAQMGADAVVDALALGQMVAEHAHGARGDDRPDLIHHPVDVIAGALVGVHRHLAGGGEGPRAEHMVGVVVGVDDRRDRLVGDLAEGGQHRFPFRHRFHGVDDNDAVVAFQHNGIGEAEAHRHVNAVGDFHHLFLEQLAVFAQRVGGRGGPRFGGGAVAAGGQGGRADRHNKKQNRVSHGILSLF